MIHFFEQIDRILEEAEWASILISILFIILIITFIVLNVITCISAISIKKSLKKLTSQEPHEKGTKKSA